MNKIYLIGKIIYISNIKYDYNLKRLDISVNILISVYDKKDKANIYKCIFKNNSIDKYYSKLKIGKKIFLIGYAKVCSEIIEIYINDLYFL